MALHYRKCIKISTVELGYNMMKGAGCFVSLQMIVDLAEEHNVTVNRGINWYHRVSDSGDKVSHQLMLL
jgi:hypothetical protein